MTTITTSLPDDLVEKLAEKAQQLNLPKNKLIEKALNLYLEYLNKAEYIQSYKKASSDTDILTIAEEGMEEYLKQLPKDETS
ncbi:CopG family transcriptional regulator [Marivirga sp. S37H4]|uniref:CopG family transcriptional regulator n=1 Tax=Marivirga aurantiaca TaxID=2802615 RepID=A0A934WVI7_9BACT|nr:ribbon-helix-helix protein, CopG family [Marivirga aurantiaca]MBK6263701.1 CopG family transcriptional regulator [Marivirga aurantiaca]